MVESLKSLKQLSHELRDALIVALRQEKQDYERQSIASLLFAWNAIPPESRDEIYAAVPTSLQKAFHAASQPVQTPSESKRKTIDDILNEQLEEELVSLQDTEANKRAQAAENLGYSSFPKSRQREVYNALISALSRDSDAKVRSQAAASLGVNSKQGETPPPVVLVTLLSVLQNDPDAEVRSSAAWSLGKLGAPTSEILVALVPLLREEGETEVRSRVAWSLGELGVPTSDVLIALRLALKNDGDIDVRSSAAWSLGQRGEATPEIIAAFLEGLQTAKDASIREGIATLLGTYGQGNMATIQVLYQGLRDRNHYVRTACSKAFIQLGQRSVALTEMLEKMLIQALADAKFDVIAVEPTAPDDPEDVGRPAYDYAYDALWPLVASSLTRGRRRREAINE